MDSDGAATVAARKKKPNSPKAPGISLRSAVAEVSKVYQRYSHGEFTRGEMAAALGMSATSGAFYAKASTLKEYGLIEDSGGNFKVSALFMAMYSAPLGSSELKRNALQAVRTSGLFSRLLGQFSAKVPEEAAVAIRLETVERFNRDRALEVAAAFRTSLSDYGLIDAIGNILPVREGPGGGPAERDEDEAPEDVSSRSGKVKDVPTGPGVFRVEVPLGSGRKAILALPEDLTPQDKDKICAILNAYATAPAVV